MAISPSWAHAISLPSCSNLADKSRTQPLRNLRFNGRRPTSSPLNLLPTNRCSSLSAHCSSPANSELADVIALTKTYKQALFDGDESAAAEIKAAFCEIEKERKRLDRKVLSLSMSIASEKETRIRLQADFDNTRKKLDKDRLSTESNAKVQIMKSLLPVIDSFERARQQTKPDTEKEKKIDTSYQGIYRQLVEALRHLRVKAIASVGKPFDPLLHEAISREESEVVKAGIISEELSRGFLLGERVLRPAKVRVSLGPIGKKTAEETRSSV